MNRLQGTHFRTIRNPPGFRVGSIFDDALDVVTSVFDRVPGSEWIKGAVSSGATWLGDFAKTPLGFFTLQVISNNLYGPIANTSLGAVSGMQTIGPQIASVVWALPGMIAGEPFTEAYIKELIDRVVGLLEWFAGKQAGAYVDQQFSEPLKRLSNDPNFKDLISQVKTQLPKIATRKALEQLHLTPDDIAARFKVRPDVAALALNAFFHEHVYSVGNPNQSEFDANGNMRNAFVETPEVPLTPTPSTGPSPFGVKPPNAGTSLPKPSGGQRDALTRVYPKFYEKGKPYLQFASLNPTGGIGVQILTAALLTSPFWFPVFVLPRIWKAADK